MNPLSSSSMAPLFNNYEQRSSNLRSKILKNEEQRIQLEQRLRFMATSNPRSYQRKQIQHIQTYFTRLNQESQRAEQRNLQLLNDLTQAQEHLDKLHSDVENLIRLKNDYLGYLEKNYPNWQRPNSTVSNTDILNNNPYDRLSQQIKQHDQLENEGNLRFSAPLAQQSYDAESSMLFKHYENRLKDGFERTQSASPPIVNREIKELHHDENSISESSEVTQSSSRGKQAGPLRMLLTCDGLYFLLDYIEKQLKDNIDRTKFYQVDPPTTAQKTTIADVANEKRFSGLEDLEPATTTMFILDRLPSTIRQNTVNKCLLTEDILSSNIQDLNRDIIAKMLPEQDRLLWFRLTDHFTQLIKLHIMNAQTLANKFALALAPANISYVHDKAKILLKHIAEKSMRSQSVSSSDDSSISQQEQPIQQNVNVKLGGLSTFLKREVKGSMLGDDDLDKSTSSTTTQKSKKSPRSPSARERDILENFNPDDDFFS